VSKEIVKVIVVSNRNVALVGVASTRIVVVLVVVYKESC